MTHLDKGSCSGGGGIVCTLILFWGAMFGPFYVSLLFWIQGLSESGMALFPAPDPPWEKWLSLLAPLGSQVCDG